MTAQQFSKGTCMVVSAMETNTLCGLVLLLLLLVLQLAGED